MANLPPSPEPPSAPGPDPESLGRTARRLAALALVGAVVHAGAGLPVLAAVLLASAVLGALVARGLHRGLPPRTAGGVLVLQLGLGVAAVQVATGGLFSPATCWLALPPLVALHVFGLRASLLATGIQGLWLLGLGTWTRLGLPGLGAPPDLSMEAALLQVLAGLLAVAWFTGIWFRDESRRREEHAKRERDFREAFDASPEPCFHLRTTRPGSGPGLARYGFRLARANRSGRTLLEQLPDPEAGLAGLLGLEEPGMLRALQEVMRRGGAWSRGGLALEGLDRHWDLTATRWGEGLALRLHDVSERVRLEEELRRSSEAEAASNRMKSEFLANMSHEIRTPMNGIIGMAGLALETEMTPEQREYLVTIRQCAESLLGLLNDILDLSKIEAGKLELEAIDFDVDEVLELVTDTLAARAGQNGLEWNAFARHDVPARLTGDPTRLRQVLINLAGNAMKFTEDGEVAVEVSLVEREEDLAWLRFEVRDTGIGIPADRLDALFEKFEQAEVSTARRYGGTGLGLAITKELVEAMGGSIHVSSEVGRGTTFTCVIPFPLPADADRPEQITDEDLVGLRVLVVDDTETNRRVLAQQLRRLGCRYELAASGEEALKILDTALEEGDPVQVLISDHRMPGLDGPELAERIRADRRFDGLRLMLLASHFSNTSAFEAREAGFEARLVKPLKERSLRRELRRLLGLARPEDEGPAPTAEGHPDFSGARVLLVEDNRVNQRLALRLLENAGLQADLAENGAEALEKVQGAEAPYHLVLMDCMMPRMDGYEATRRIRALEDPDRSGIPVVAMTANAMQGDREKCLAAGMDDYLSKPLQREEFLLMLQRWLRPGTTVPPPA